MNDRPRDPESLLHSPRQSANHGIALHFQGHLPYDFGDPRSDVPLRDSVGMSEVVQVFPDFQIFIYREKVG